MLQPIQVASATWMTWFQVELKACNLFLKAKSENKVKKKFIFSCIMAVLKQYHSRNKCRKSTLGITLFDSFMITDGMKINREIKTQYNPHQI